MTDVKEVITEFRALVRWATGAEPTDKTCTALGWVSRRIGADTARDLAVTAVLECIPRTDSIVRHTAKDDEIRRALWRLVKAAARENTRKAISFGTVLDPVAPSIPPDQRAITVEEAGRLSRVIQSALTPDEQNLVLLMTEGLPVAEIVKCLDQEVSNEAMRQRISRLKKKLRSLLAHPQTG